MQHAGQIIHARSHTKLLRATNESTFLLQCCDQIGHETALLVDVRILWMVAFEGEEGEHFEPECCAQRVGLPST
jgi:hypothetical protein